MAKTAMLSLARFTLVAALSVLFVLGQGGYLQEMAVVLLPDAVHAQGEEFFGSPAEAPCGDMAAGHDMAAMKRCQR